MRFCKDPILLKEDEDSWFAILTSTEDGQRDWYARVCQIPMIRENGILYFTSDDQDRKRIESYPFSNPLKYLTYEEFYEIFYPKSH